MHAHIAPVPGSWHVLRCQPGREHVAQKHLADVCRIGTYLPLEDHYAGKRADELKKQTPLFRGYLFVWVWGLAENINLIRGAPGVIGFLTETSGKPVILPDSVARALELIEQRQWLERLPRAWFRRRRSREQWTVPPWKHRNYGFHDPDPDARLAALHRALGL